MSARDVIKQTLAFTYNRGISASKSYIDESADELLNKILDFATDEIDKDAIELGIDEQARHYLKTGINKLRD